MQGLSLASLKKHPAVSIFAMASKFNRFPFENDAHRQTIGVNRNKRTHLHNRAQEPMSKKKQMKKEDIDQLPSHLFFLVLRDSLNSRYIIFIAVDSTVRLHDCWCWHGYFLHIPFGHQKPRRLVEP